MSDTDQSLYNLRYNQVTQGMEGFGGGTPMWTPLSLAADGGITQLTGDVAAGPGSGSQGAVVPQLHNANIGGTGTVTPVATNGGTFTATVSGSLTINGPTGGYNAQKATFRIVNDGSHSVTLATGSGNFRFGSDITSYTNSVSLTDYIGAIYNLAALRWDVVSIIQGF